MTARLRSELFQVAMPPGVFTDLLLEACLRFCGKKGMDNEIDNSKLLHLPRGANMPRNQVAGHKHEGRSKLGLLEFEDGSILKAVQKPPRGMRELRFYEKIFDEECTQEDILQLKQFLPKFYGAHCFEEYPGVTYLKLENLVSKFRKPCVVDIKMGKKTYDPEAGPGKIAKEITKFPHVEKFGFQFTGMQTYNPVDQKIHFYDKFFCRKLGEDEIVRKGLGTYFGLQHGLRKDAIVVLLGKLREIEQWFMTQRRFAFYASSLLVIYEGDMQDNDEGFPCSHCKRFDCTHSTSESEQTDLCASSENIEETDGISTEQADSGISSETTDSVSLTASISDISVDTPSTTTLSSTSSAPPLLNSNAHSGSSNLAEVRMIDFTHVFSVSEQDDNYLYGLKNLIRLMEELLEMNV